MCIIRYRAWQLCCHRTDQKNTTETCDAAACLPAGAPCQSTRYEPTVATSGLCPCCKRVFLDVNERWNTTDPNLAGLLVKRAAVQLRDTATANFYNHWERQGPEHNGAAIYQRLLERVLFCAEITIRLQKTREDYGSERFAEEAFWAFHELTDHHKGLDNLSPVDYRRVMMMAWRMVKIEHIGLGWDGWDDRLQREMLKHCELSAIRLGLVNLPTPKGQPL